MQFFRDLPVRKKLFGGFGVVLVLSAIMGVVLLAQLGTVNRDGAYVGTNSLPSVVTIENIKADVIDYRRAQLAYILKASPAQAVAARGDWTADATQIQTLLGRYKSMVSNSQDAQVYHLFQSGWSGYLRDTAQIVTLGANASDHTATLALVRTTKPTFASLKQVADAWVNVNVKLASQKVNSNGSTYSTAMTLGIGELVLTIAIGMGIAFLVSRFIKGGVDVVLDRLSSLRDKCATNLKAGIEALANGDLTVSVQAVTEPIENPSKDEIGQVADAVNGVRERFAAGIDAYNQTRANLSEIIGDVSGSAGQVSAASQEMASSADETGKATSEIAHAVGDVAQGAERQVKMVEAAKHAAEDVARAVTESADHANQAAEVANQTRTVAHEGVSAAAEANAAMDSVRDSSQAVSEAIRELAGKSDQIGAIVATITSIAEQTNLLALNAAIEAARAGEQGRGFAVVAEEVRKLAEDSQHAAHEISGLIGAIQTDTSHAVEVVADGAKRTQDGAAVVEKTREAFQQIESSVHDMTARIEQIAAASQQIATSAQSMQQSIGEVAAVAEQSSASTEEVSASTEQTSASAQQIAASAQQLSGNAETLNHLVAKFKLKA